MKYWVAKVVHYHSSILGCTGVVAVGNDATASFFEFFQIDDMLSLSFR